MLCKDLSVGHVFKFHGSWPFHSEDFKLPSVLHTKIIPTNLDFPLPSIQHTAQFDTCLLSRKSLFNSFQKQKHSSVVWICSDVSPSPTASQHTKYCPGI